MPPGSAAEQQQKAQIPKDLEDLRLALAAAKETQGTGARPVLTQQGQGGALTKPGADALQTPYGGATPYTNGNGSGYGAGTNGGTNGAGMAIQAELARLRFQVDHLKEENARVHAELDAAKAVLVGPEAAIGISSAACSGPLSSSTALATLGGGASGGGQGVVPLQLRVQAQQAELNDAKMRAQQSAGVAQARQREMEALQQQVAAAPSGLLCHLFDMARWWLAFIAAARVAIDTRVA